MTTKILPTQAEIEAYADKLGDEPLSDEEGTNEGGAPQGEAGEDTNTDEDVASTEEDGDEGSETDEGAGEPARRIPKDRFDAVNQRMKNAEAKLKEFDEAGYQTYLTKKEHYSKLDTMDQQLGAFFKDHPEELTRLQTAMKTGKAPEEEPTPEGIDDDVWKRLKATEAETKRLREEADARRKAEATETEVARAQTELNAEIDEFRADKKYGGLVTDRVFMKTALDSALAQNKPFNEVALELAKWDESRRNSAIAGLAQGAERRKGAKVETGGGPAGSVIKPRAKVGSDEELQQMMEKYGIED